MNKIKRLFSLILSLALIIGCAQLPTNLIKAEEGETIVYVADADNGGSDETGDGSATAPYATINKAQADLTENGGKIIVTGTVDFDGGVEHDKMITIEGSVQTSGLNLIGTENAYVVNQYNNGKYSPMVLKGPTTLDNITVVNTDVSTVDILTNGNEFVVGSKFKSKIKRPYLGIGNNLDGSTKDEIVTVNANVGSGSGYSSCDLRIGHGDYYASQRTAGSLRLTVNAGAHVNIVCYQPILFKGNMDIIWNGGSFTENILKTASNAQTEGALQVILNNGMNSAKVDETAKTSLTAAAGKWFMYGDKSGGTLNTTKTAGLFEVNSDKVAQATNVATGEVYQAAPGAYLSVPAGEYTVTYVAVTEDNKNSGTVIRYVSETGNDENDGLTAETAYATFSKAIRALDALNADTRTLLVDGTVTYSGDIAATNRVTIQGADLDAAVQLGIPSHVTMNYDSIYNVAVPEGPLTFDNINIKTTSQTYQIISRGHELVFGNGCKFDVVNKYYLLGGTAKNTPIDSKLVLNTGIANSRYHGSQVHIGIFNIDYNEEDKLLGRTELVINGGAFRLLRVNPGIYTDDLNIVVNGGWFTTGNGLNQNVNLRAGSDASNPSVSDITAQGAIQIILNNGYVANSNDFSLNDVDAEGGNWLIYGDTSGGQLATTDTAGTFKVESTLYAKATLTTDSTKVYYGAPGGNIVMPEGTYNVTYVATPPGLYEVTVDGVSQGVYTEGSQFTLPSAPTKEDYEFVGWTDGTNTYPAETTVKVESDLNFLSAWKTDVAIAYVSTSGNDASGDGTEAKPYATIAKAQTVLDVIDAKERRVVLLDDTAVTAATHKNMIVVRGNTNAVKLTGELKDLSGPTTYENLFFKAIIYNNSNELIFGENISTSVGSNILNVGPVADNATVRDNIVINSAGSSLSSNDIMLRAGAFNSSKVTPGFDLTVNDGYFHQLFLQNDTIFNGTVNITINNAAVEAKGILSNGTVTFNENAAFQIINNNGKGNKLFGDVFANIDVPAGKWFIYDEFVENTTGSYIRPEYNRFYGCRLEMTDTVGTYKIVNGSSLDTVFASLTNLENPGIVYYSENGYISVPAGEWYVTYMEELPAFVSTGGEIYFNETVENFDFADVNSVYTEGKVIIGWKNGDSLAQNGATFQKGTRLTAVYADTADRYESFKIVDKTLRLDGEDGIRYTVKLNNSFFNALGGTEYGIIAIDSANVPYVTVGDIVIGGNYSGKSPAVIKADRKFLDYENSVGYTLCLTGITEENYDTDYMVRGYLKFTDLQGIERVIYTPFDQSSIRAITLEMLSSEDVPEKAKEHISTVYKTVIDNQRAELAAEYKNQLTTNAKDSYGFSVLDNGVKVMNFNIDAVDGANDEVITLSHVTDVHLNVLNERDFANARPEVISFYRNRYHLKDAQTAKATKNMMKAADALSEQVILTGDTLDALNYGSLDLMKRLMITPYPNAIHASGNHELWQDTGVGQISDTMTMDEKRAVYQEYMPHDSAYSTKLLKNKVLLIQIDNAVSWGEGSYSYSEEQYQALSRDLAMARENNYTVIIAQHLPLQFGVKTGDNKNNNQILEANAPNNLSGVKVDMSSNDAYIMTDPAGTMGTRTVATKTHRLITSYSDVIKGILVGHHHDAAVLDVIDIDTNEMTGIKQYMGGSAQGGKGIMFTFEIK